MRSTFLIAMISCCAIACSSGKQQQATDAARDITTLVDLGDETSTLADGGRDTRADIRQRDAATSDSAVADATVDSSSADSRPSADLFLSDAGLPQNFVAITADQFTMGSRTAEPCRNTSGREEQRTVSLTRNYEIMATEVTQAMFAAQMGYNPSYFKPCDNCPVENVNWHEAAAYCNALSIKAGLTPCYQCPATVPASNVSCSLDPAHSSLYDCKAYRLPTEAEWEFAYRAGTVSGFYNGEPDPATCTDCLTLDVELDQIAWYCVNAGSPKPVAGKAANAWGIHDMAGNVWEWCHDVFEADVSQLSNVDPTGPASGDSRVVRGGAASTYAATHRAAARHFELSTARSVYHGFRCARSP